MFYNFMSTDTTITLPLQLNLSIHQPWECVMTFPFRQKFWLPTIFSLCKQHFKWFLFYSICQAEHSHPIADQVPQPKIWLNYTVLHSVETQQKTFSHSEFVSNLKITLCNAIDSHAIRSVLRCYGAQGKGIRFSAYLVLYYLLRLGHCTEQSNSAV